MDTTKLRKRMPVSTLFDPKIVVPAIGSAFVKLDPRTLIKNPVMFVLEVVTILTTVILVVGGLTFFPALALGPIVEHLANLANTVFFNITGAVAMFVGRFFMIIPAMAIAGSLVEKKSVPATAGTFPTTGGLFIGLVVGVILIVGGLTFFPALALGPIVEHLAMRAGTAF